MSNKFIKTGVSYINIGAARTINVLPEDLDAYLEMGGEEDYVSNNLGSELYVNYADFESTIALFDLKKEELQARIEAFMTSDQTVLDLSDKFLDVHFSEDDTTYDELPDPSEHKKILNEYNQVLHELGHVKSPKHSNKELDNDNFANFDFCEDKECELGPKAIYSAHDHEHANIDCCGLDECCDSQEELIEEPCVCTDHLEVSENPNVNTECCGSDDCCSEQQEEQLQADENFVYAPMNDVQNHEHEHQHDDLVHSHEHNHEDHDHNHSHDEVNFVDVESHQHEHEHDGLIHSHEHDHDDQEHSHNHDEVTFVNIQNHEHEHQHDDVVHSHEHDHDDHDHNHSHDEVNFVDVESHLHEHEHDGLIHSHEHDHDDHDHNHSHDYFIDVAVDSQKQEEVEFINLEPETNQQSTYNHVEDEYTYTPVDLSNNQELQQSTSSTSEESIAPVYQLSTVMEIDDQEETNNVSVQPTENKQTGFFGKKNKKKKKNKKR